LRTHEKTAFLKFFVTYFLSVALLILAVGFFYFEQMQGVLLKKEHFTLIEYARHIKMGESLKNYGDAFHYKYVLKEGVHIDIRNFNIDNGEFSKFIPFKNSYKYLQVFKSKKNFDEKLHNLKINIIMIQSLLLLFFAFISYFLAKKALKPLNDSIETLDKFAKDLIHDLNTPVGAMKLNIKLLEKNEHVKDTTALQRLKKSVNTISELKESLTTLLEKKTFQVRELNICQLANEVIGMHQQNYPHLHLRVSCSSMMVVANENALKQILHNLISNACKYNIPDGSVNIYMKDNSLCIQDTGLGIQEPEKIFEREYSAQNSSGLGLDIVKRLCESMNISIKVSSDENGSLFCLEFQK